MKPTRVWCVVGNGRFLKWTVAATRKDSIALLLCGYTHRWREECKHYGYRVVRCTLTVET